MTAFNPGIQQNREFLFQLLTKAARSPQKNSVLLFVNMIREETLSLEGSNQFRLFFLLEGEVSLNGKTCGSHLLHHMNAILLPPSEQICCCASDKSVFVVLQCEDLKYAGNIRYFTRLKELLGKEGNTSRYRTLPLHETLASLLRIVIVNDTSGLWYSNLFEIFFILLRALYAEKKLAEFFAPMIRL